MKNIYSNIFTYNQKNLNKCILALERGNVVGVPTETVYGLAGNAYSKKAVSKIFRLKKRPKLNPLIVHYSDYKKAERDVVLNKKFFKLYKKFCPGPITFILKKKKNSKIHKLVNGNLKTVAVRFPNHKVAKILSSKSEARRAIANKGVKINNLVVQDEKKFIEIGDFIKDTMKLSFGKKKHYLVKY